MVRYLLATVCIFAASISGISQPKYLCKNGHIWFYSRTPLEEIEAHSYEAASVIDTKTGDIAYQVLIKSFTFKRALMEEHFNENYMESSRYPKSELRGNITNLDSIDFSKPGVYKALVEGNLTIHNTTRSIREQGTIIVEDGKLHLNAKFDVIPQDYNIDIPGIVRDKIAKSITVTIEMVYNPYTKSASGS